MDNEEPLDLRVGITIYPYHEVAIQQVLTKLKEDCPAKFILLADTSGQLITIEGERGEIDPPSLACLVAGDYMASREIARLTKTYDVCQLVVREGKEYNIFLAEIGSYLVMLVIVTANVPVGWARLLILDASEKINRIISTTPAHFQRGETSSPVGGSQAESLIEASLGSIFRNCS